jgi:hypothetical protein
VVDAGCILEYWGLGGLVKRKEVRKLVGEKHPNIVCL